MISDIVLVCDIMLVKIEVAFQFFEVTKPKQVERTLLIFIQNPVVSKKYSEEIYALSAISVKCGL